MDRRERGLVERFRAGDEAVLEEIIADYKGPLHRYIFRYVGDASEAEDILSQTFVKAWGSRHRYRHKARFQTWLYTIATNLCRDHGRKRRRRPGDFAADFDPGDYLATREAGSLDSSASTGAIPSEEAAVHEEAELVRHAIDELPGELKSALLLFALEGHSQEATATLLGCSAKAVETRVYRAKKRLRKKLAWLRED